MRRAAAFAILPLLAMPAMAQTKSLEEQFDATLEMFGTNPGSVGDFLLSTPAALAKDLAGSYFNVGVLGYAAPDAVEKACGATRIDVDAADPTRLVFHFNAGKEYGYKVVFTSVGGITYGAAADRKELVDYLSGGKGGLPIMTEVSIVASWNGLVTIFRPQPDIIFIQSATRQVSLLARCPEAP